MPILNGKGLSPKYCSEEDRDQFVFEHKKGLILHLIYDWPRRNRSLLEIGCGTGEFLELFWEAGFDIAGIDSSPTRIYRARSRLGSRADLYISHADHLAFEDKHFDYVALINVLEFSESPEDVLREVLRMAKKGFIIVFLNRLFWYSLIGGDLTKKWTGSFYRDGQRKGRSWPGIKRMLRSNIPGSFTFTAGSVLPCPHLAWFHYCWLQKTGKKIYSPCWGMFSAVKVDLLNEKPMTPLMAWETEPKAI